MTHFYNHFLYFDINLPIYTARCIKTGPICIEIEHIYDPYLQKSASKYPPISPARPVTHYIQYPRAENILKFKESRPKSKMDYIRILLQAHVRIYGLQYSTSHPRMGKMGQNGTKIDVFDFISNGIHARVLLLFMGFRLEPRKALRDVLIKFILMKRLLGPWKKPCLSSEH